MANTTGKKFGGRKKGTQNKVTTDLRASIKLFLDNNWSQAQAEFDELGAKDKLAFLEKLLKYALPTLQATTLDVPQLDINALTTEQVDAFFEKLIN